jgi:hypothetical protein
LVGGAFEQRLLRRRHPVAHLVERLGLRCCEHRIRLQRFAALLCRHAAQFPQRCLRLAQTRREQVASDRHLSRQQGVQFLVPSLSTFYVQPGTWLWSARQGQPHFLGRDLHGVERATGKAVSRSDDGGRAGGQE